MMLPESLLLLALNDERGTLRDDSHHALVCLNYALAGAVIGELTLAGYLGIEQDALVVLNPPPTGDALLDDALQQIEREHEPHPLRDWVERLRHSLHDIRHRLGDQLAADGVVQREQHRLFGVVPITHYPVVDPWVKTTLASSLSLAALKQGELDTRARLLLTLAYLAEVLTDLFAGVSDETAEAMRERLAALTLRDPVAAAVAATIAFVEAPSVESGA